MTTMRLLMMVLVIGMLLTCAAGSYAQGFGGPHHGGGHGGPGWNGHHGGWGGPGHHNGGWQPPVQQTVVYGPCGPRVVFGSGYYRAPQPVYGINPWGQVVIIGYR